MKVEVLGSGCRKCATLESSATQALQDLGLSVTVEKITDFVDIAARGVMSTPALCIDGHVAVAGRVPSVEELKELIPRWADRGERSP